MDALAIGFKAHSLLEPDVANPIGTITLWSGALGAIPAGWQLCDGTNGTPDLRSKFVKGAGPGTAVDSTGGSVNHTHDFIGDGHIHGISGIQAVAVGFGVDVIPTGMSTDSQLAEGTTLGASNEPEFYGLAYIQRMS